MPGVALEDLAVHQLCSFAARRKALVRLANVASAGGCKRDDRLAGLRVPEAREDFICFFDCLNDLF